MTGQEGPTVLTDDDLRAFLDEAAREFPPPAHGPDWVVAATAATTRRSPGPRGGADVSDPPSSPRLRPGGNRPRRRLLTAVAAVVVLAAGLSFAFGQTSGDDQASERSAADRTETTSAEDAPGDTVADAAELEQASEAPSSQGTVAGGTDAKAPATSIPSAPNAPSQMPALPGSAKLIKTAGLDLLVGEGRVPEAFDRLTTLAVGSGGVVADQQTHEFGDDPSGTITLRVPGAAFEDTLGRARQLGEVESATTSGQDVTAEFTDIEGRLRSLNDERDQLRLLLGQATTIDDTLAVRDRLTSVQTEIEQLQGRRQVLDDQVSLSTITVSVRERPEDGERPILDPGPDEQSGFTGAWHDAVDGFNRGLQALIAGSGQTLLVLLCAGAAALAARGLWRYGRRRLV